MLLLREAKKYMLLDEKGKNKMLELQEAKKYINIAICETEHLQEENKKLKILLYHYIKQSGDVLVKPETLTQLKEMVIEEANILTKKSEKTSNIAVQMIAEFGDIIE